MLRGEAFGIGVVVAAADGDGGAGEIPPARSAAAIEIGAARRFLGDGAQLLAGVLDEDVDGGAGRRQQLDLPRHRRALTGHHRALAVEREEDRQPRQRRHARRAVFGGAAFNGHQ